MQRWCPIRYSVIVNVVYIPSDMLLLLVVNGVLAAVASIVVTVAANAIIEYERLISIEKKISYVFFYIR